MKTKDYLKEFDDLKIPVNKIVGRLQFAIAPDYSLSKVQQHNFGVIVTDALLEQAWKTDAEIAKLRAEVEAAYVYISELEKPAKSGVIKNEFAAFLHAKRIYHQVRTSRMNEQGKTA